MKPRITSPEICSYLQGSPGELTDAGEYRFNHTYCPAGWDTKRRLYIRRTTEGKWLAYCHNCGGAGVYDPHRGSIPPVGPTQAMIAHTNLPQSPPMPNWIWDECIQGLGPMHNYSHKPGNTSPCFCAALNKENGTDKYFLEEWAPTYNVFWWNFSAFSVNFSMVLPADFDPNTGVPRMFSIRTEQNPKASRNLPKWYHIRMDGKRISPILDNPDQKDLVIVEDRLSGICIAELGPFAACTLNGTNLNDEDLFKLSMLYERIVVWLDNDSEDVKEKSRDIARRFAIFGKPAYSNADASVKEPKHYASMPDGIRGYLLSYFYQ